MKINKKKNKSILLFMAIALSSTSVLATRYISGPPGVQNEDITINQNTQQIQANEQTASGQMNSDNNSRLNNEQQNISTQQRVLESQIGGTGLSAITPPVNYYNPAQQEQLNLQSSSIDTQLSAAGASAPPAEPQQQINNTSNTSVNGPAANSYGP